MICCNWNQKRSESNIEFTVPNITAYGWHDGGMIFNPNEIVQSRRRTRTVLSRISNSRNRYRHAIALKETLAQLNALGDDKVRAHNKKYGAGDNQFGVKLGDIRKLAAKIKAGHPLAIALLETGNIDEMVRRQS